LSFFVFFLFFENNIQEQFVLSTVVTFFIETLLGAFTVGVRFANNVHGGMQFVDGARMSAC
jgi:hypothetical protein